MIGLSGVLAVRRSASPTSPWTESYSSSRDSLRSVTADSSTFAAVNLDSDVYTVSNPATGTWAKSSNSPALNSYYIDHCNSYWIILHNSSLSTSTSATGSWTANALGFVGPTKAIYSSTASLYIIGGNSGNLYTASDPTSTWTSRTSNFGTSTIWDIYDNGSLIVAVGNDGKMATSTDGITWTIRTSSFGAAAIKGVIYGGTTWVFTGPGKIGTSTDPTSSVTQNTSSGITTGEDLGTIAYSGTMFVTSGDTTSFNIYETTTPAGAWTKKPMWAKSTMINSNVSNSSYFCALTHAYTPGKIFGRAV